MNRLSTLLIGALIGAAAMFTAMKYHVVRAEDGLHMIPKVSAELSGAYVDIREFDASHWDDHRALAVSIVNADKEYLLKDSAASTFRHTVDSVLHSLGRKPN
jgi:hypothetical protein